MSEEAAKSATPVGPDEKAYAVMGYLQDGVVWGNAVIKEQIRISTWLRTSAAPDFLTLYEGKYLNTTGGVNQKPISFPELHVPTKSVLGFHALPPYADPLDYDPTEENRRMDPVSVLVGSFRFDAFIRLSAISTMGKYIEVTREEFSLLYDLSITCLTIPTLGTMKAPFAIVRQQLVNWCKRP
jgi:hypothetical protein